MQLCQSCAVCPELLGFGCRLFLHSLVCSQLSAVQQWPHSLGQAQENSRGAPWLCGCVLAELLFIAHCWPQLPSLPALSHCCGLCSAGIPEKLLRGFAVPADWAGAVDYMQRDADYLQNHKCTNGGMRMPLTGMNLQVWADKKRLGGSSPRGAVRQDEFGFRLTVISSITVLPSLTQHRTFFLFI